jgi:hypothetical protein
MNMQIRSLAATTALTLGLILNAQADTLMIDAVSQSAGVDRPGKGQRMSQVEARFGAPREVVPAVGEPPITRWVYEGYTVYFEGDIVLHAVAKR